MKKGELRRKEILDAAERLFYEKGYEATSVQDILDALSLSKGGFYHHFETKMAVLEAICERRAEEQFQAVALELRVSRAGTLERFNRLLTMINIFEREQTAFVAMVLRICYQAGDVSLRERMKAITIRLFLPLMNEIIAQGIEEKVFFTRRPGTIGQVILLLEHDLIDAVSACLVEGSENPETVVEVMDLLGTYRDSVELLLNAPYGSVELFELERMLEIFRNVMDELNRMDAEMQEEVR